MSGVITLCAEASACEEGQRRRQASHLLRAMRCSAIVPEVITCCADVSACGEDRQRQPALPLLRAMRRSFLEPDVLPCWAKVGVYEEGQQCPRTRVCAKRWVTLFCEKWWRS